jgi:hypothetical protein
MRVLLKTTHTSTCVEIDASHHLSFIFILSSTSWHADEDGRDESERDVRCVR